mmetsp:Transcript_5628/g.10039  ORF Transcript_5628/g.10039 Transcript_5628/m.10039 type:complete len:207 (+) Transcript_5628:278-898(+)|eukprot:CAMPEP_0184697030 /NCGR_PEP_ID=MMETSP0313-20130426/4146_1 /TAXON_ID=2792 /ORGANISM="Porphyridium aerugineum, Strain SAG 1380-2" /LENGTH=206 /DNA_ID=CAMNT_0027155791 /DNA_START=210 /DNA_END=830 /DNA_ORIENTATION=-
MGIVITEEQFHSLFPKNPSPGLWASRLTKALTEEGLATQPQVAMFLAQCGYESASFTVFEEQLNYKADRLGEVFGKYFTTEEVKAFAGKPEKIANRVYAGRNGNGLESTGDGWKYRGRGPIQITGKENYRDCSKALYKDDKLKLVEKPELLVEDPEVGLKVALWFWKSRELQSVASVKQATKLVNGGSHGLEARQKLYDDAMKVLK